MFEANSIIFLKITINKIRCPRTETTLDEQKYDIVNSRRHSNRAATADFLVPYCFISDYKIDVTAV